MSEMSILRMLGLSWQNATKRSTRALQGLARVLLSWLIGITLCVFGAAVAEAPNASALKLTAKQYAKTIVTDKSEFKCLTKLWTLESNWNYKAINKSGGAYGIPQIKNPILKDMNQYKQVDLGIKYLNHRYSSICSALKLWNKRAGYDWVGGWY